MHMSTQYPNTDQVCNMMTGILFTVKQLVRGSRRRVRVVGGADIRPLHPREGGVPSLPGAQVAEGDGQVPSREKRGPQDHGVPLCHDHTYAKQAPGRTQLLATFK